MIHERIITDPNSSDGAPVLRDSRIPVHQVLSHAAHGKTPEEIVAELPGLELADVQAALAYAADRVRREAADETSPAQTGSPSRPPQETERSGESAALDLNRILIVDDHEMNRLYLQTLFKDSGYALSIASDGTEALAKAQAELPFLILSDIQMPGMDGFELCHRLKTDERTKNAAVVFITAHHRSSQKVSEGLDIGADDYIFRPFERGELMSRVQAVARIKRAEEEARYQAQMAARRNRELELLNELALTAASSLDFESVFANSMPRLSQLLDAEAVALLLLDAEVRQFTVHFSSRKGKRVSTSASFEFEEGITVSAIQEHMPSTISSLLDDSGTDLDMDRAFEPHSVTCVPITRKEQIVGAIAIINKRGDGFSAADWVLLKSAAGIVAIAVENVRLLQSVQQQVAHLVLLNEIGHALTSTLNLEQILHHTTRLVQELLRAETTFLWLLDEAGQELVLTASSGPAAQLEIGFRQPIHGSTAGYVAQTGVPFISSDVPSEKTLNNDVDKLSDYPPSSILCVPVMVKEQIIGVVQALHQNPHWFDQNDLRLLYSVASSVGIAIENARLFAEVQEFSRQLEHRVAERTRELAEEKEKTEAILTSMADGLLVLDADNRILTANTVAEGMLDFRLGEVQGQPISAEHLTNPLWCRISDMASGDGFTARASVDIPDPTQSGSVLSIQALAARVQDESGQIIGTVIVLHDITTLKEIERIKARFMAGVTHELKTPLSVIRLHANNLKSYHARLPERKRNELLDGIQAQANLLEQLVEDILALSHLDAGEVRGERHPVNLTHLSDNVIDDLRPLAANRQVALHWTKPVADAIILADENQIKRMIQNLIDNAIKYTSPGGSVELALTSESPNRVTVRVTDTGIGIPPEFQSRIFDRFFRLDPSHTIPGTGLGLSIVKEIVIAHGGDIQLDSTPGVGSTFTVTLPGVERQTKNPSTL